jgi:hypothetical protein
MWQRDEINQEDYYSHTVADGTEYGQHFADAGILPDAAVDFQAYEEKERNAGDYGDKGYEVCYVLGGDLGFEAKQQG